MTSCGFFFLHFLVGQGFLTPASGVETPANARTFKDVRNKRMEYVKKYIYFYLTQWRKNMWEGGGLRIFLVRYIERRILV